MSVSDPIGDMLTRVRNASMIGHSVVVMPSSRLKVAIANILKDEGYIDDFSVRDMSEMAEAMESSAQTLTFQLVVNDGVNSSAADTVNITIASSNATPVANAGPDQTVTAGSLVQLTGAASSDIDGNPLTYAWSFVSRPATSLAVLMGIAKPTPALSPVRLAIAVFMPTTSPFMSNSGPPELPGLIAASVWMKSA